MATTAQAGLYQTGDKAPYTGRYEFVRYTDGSTTPAPTIEEKIIPLSRDEVFPPVRSCNKGALRRFIG